MGKPAGRGSSLSNQMKRSDDVDAIARAIGQQERMSFLSTELARTEGLGFLATPLTSPMRPRSAI